MVEINITNFITIGLMSLLFFAIVEFGKKKFGADTAKKDEA